MAATKLEHHILRDKWGNKHIVTFPTTVNLHEVRQNQYRLCPQETEEVFSYYDDYYDDVRGPINENKYYQCSGCRYMLQECQCTEGRWHLHVLAGHGLWMWTKHRKAENSSETVLNTHRRRNR